MKRICSIFALACCLLAACDKYDDSALKDALSSLETRVEALESLNGELEALKAIVEGKVTVTSCVEADGVCTITFSDGKTVKVQTEAELDGMSVVTVFEEDGKSYWGYYADGKVTPLLNAGNKVEVTSVIPGVRINDDNHIEISVDGGKTWIESETAISGSLFSNVEECDDYIVLTLSDGYTQYMVPLYEEKSMQFVAFSGKQFFNFGETRNVAVEMVGVDNFTVTEKPEGWKAVLSEGQLKITAPTQDAGEISGVIKILGVGSEPMIAQVYVEIGTAPCSIVISDDKTVTVSPIPQSCFYGACLLEDFNPKKLVKELGSVTNPMLSRYPYAQDSDLTVPLSDLLTEIVAGEIYVVWALPMGAGSESDMIYEAVSSIGVSYDVTGVTFEDAHLSVSVKGTDTYYLVPISEDMTLDTVISDLNGSFAATYDRYRHMSSFRGLLSDVVENPMAGNEYELLILPVKFGQLRKADAVSFKASLNTYTRGGSASVELKVENTDLKSLSVNVSATNYPYKVMAVVVTADEYTANGYADDSKLLDFLSGIAPVQYEEPYTYVARYLESDTDYWMLAAAIDRNGVMGSPARLDTATKGVEYSSETISLGTETLSLDSALIPISGSDKVVRYRYMVLSSAEGGYWYTNYIESDEAAYNALIYGTADYTDISAENLADGVYVQGLEFGTGYIFRVIGYDADGKITNMAKLDFSPSVGKVIKSTDTQWQTARPEVSAVIMSNAIKLSVNFPNGCIKYSLTRVSSEEYAAQMPGAARQRADYVLGHYSVLNFTENIDSYDPGWYISFDKPYILITWQDENGWYEPLVYDSATGKILN